MQILYYIIINEKLKNSIKYSIVLEGTKNDSEHMAVESGFEFRRRIIHNKRHFVPKRQFKTHVIEQEIIWPLNKAD
jgi:hypothetical protein